MQHHSHQTRQPHMRGHHVQHQQTAPPPHLALNLGLPQQQQNVAAHQPQQQPPTPHHMNNVGPPLGISQTSVNTQQQPKSSYMQPHNRMSHHQQQQQQHHLMQAQHQQLQQRINPQTIHTTNQMQKIRQQHQLVNNSNNNNSIIINQHQQQTHQQHQRNIHHNTHHVPHLKPQQQQQQQQQHITNVNQPISILKHPQQHEPLQQQQKPHAANVSILKQPQPPQKLPANNTSATVGLPQQQIPQQHCFPPVENKSIYTKSAAFTPAVAAPSVPKSILQNPNRLNNNKQTNTVATPAKESTIANIAHTEADAPPIVSAKQSILETAVSSEDSSSTEAVSDKENVPAITTANDCDGELSSDNAISLILDPNSGSSSKEKTPMCLVNELARFNKITHQYRLTNEKGPAHCKRFTVTLKLGDEEYSAEGYKIKKAQHLAAAEAIEKTKYKHPAPKLVRRTEEGGTTRATITPTVELNALAMKLGQQTYYLFDPRSQPSPDNIMPTPGPDMMYRPPPHGPPLPHGGASLMPPPPHHMMDAGNPYMRRHAAQYQQRFNNYRGGYSHPNKFIQRYPLMPPPLGHNGMPPHHHQHSVYPPPPATLCKITLIVGKQKFIGSGRTLQAAKHDAASRALQVLKTQAASKLNDILNRSLEESDSKSPISLVHEIGIKRSMTVHFKVLREEGPAHMKNFITACIAGNIITEGDGNGKKISKKRAAEKMLEELKKLPPLTPTKSPVKRLKVKPAGGAAATGTERKKRAGGTSIKEKSEADIADCENPISKLIVLLQSRKEAEPVYELISKNGNETTRRREFIMEVTAAGKAARGTGNNMKTAKRNAAQTLLDILCGGSNSDATAAPSVPLTVASNNAVAKPIQPMEPDKNGASLQMDAIANNVAKTVLALQPPFPAAEKTSAIDLPLVTTTAGQVPGILILRQNKKNSTVKHAVKNVVAPVLTTAAATPKIAPPVEAHVVPATKASVAPAPTTAPACENANTTAKVNTTSEVAETISPLNTSTVSNTSTTSSSSSDLRMKHQLLYLAQLLGFEVDFNDYPKGNHNEFLTIVTLTTTPAQICHGTGANSEESQNDASRNALKILSELGLNNVKSK